MMGICISKRDHNRLAHSGKESVREAELASAQVFTGGDYAARVVSQELSSYNVFFDEWGARFIESGSRRWHVVHMPGTTKFSLQEDRGRARDLCGRAELYSKEVYGDISFSSYLSSPLMNLQAPCPPSTPPLHNPLDVQSYVSSSAEYAEKSPVCLSNAYLLLNTDSTTRNSASAASLPQRSGDLNFASEADQRDSWIPVLTVESARHPESSQEMISIKLKKRVATSSIEAEGASNLSATISNQNMLAAVVPSSATNGAGEIGVFDAEKYFKANDQQRADLELGLACNNTREVGPVVVDRILSAGSSARGSDVQDAASFYQYRNSTAASSDVSYDSRSALSGTQKFASSDAMWNSSPCNTRDNSCNKRIKPNNNRGRTSSRKGCRWSFCSRKSVVDAMDEAGIVTSARSKRRSIKVQDSVKLDSLQFPPTSGYNTAPIMPKLEMPKSSQQSRNSCKSMSELPQPLSPLERMTNLFGVAEAGGPKSLDYVSASRIPSSLSNSLGVWSSRPISTECADFVPSPMRAQSARQQQHSMVLGFLQLGQDQILGDGTLRVSQTTGRVGRCTGESSDGYSGNCEFRLDSFLQGTSATARGCGDRSDIMLLGSSVQIPTECQASMLGPVFPDLSPHPKANDGASAKCVAGEKLEPFMSSVPHFEMAMESGLPAQGIEKNAELSECNHFGKFLSSMKAKPLNPEEEAAAAENDEQGTTLHQKVVSEGEEWVEEWADIDRREDELEDMEHRNFNRQVMARKNCIIQKGSECFTFPNLVCLPSSIPLEEKQGIQRLPFEEEEQSIQHISSEEEQSIHHLHKNSSFLRSPSNKEFCQDEVGERACTSSCPSGASTPTSSSGGAGSAFGSPFSVAASCPSSDFRSRDELIKRLCIYSQQSRQSSLRDSIQASVSSTFSSNQRPTLPNDASHPSWFDGNEVMVSDYQHAEDQSLHTHAKHNIDFDNAERLTYSNELQQLGHGYSLSKEELHEMDSDSSSDLFDLESLAGRGEGADHGLPVFEMQNDPSCLLPGSLFTVSVNSTYKGFSSSVVLLAGDQATGDHTVGIVPNNKMQLHEELDSEEEEYNCKQQSVEGMSTLMKRRLSLLS